MPTEKPITPSRPMRDYMTAKQLDETAIQSHYVRARLFRTAERASMRMIRYLRHRLLDDKRLDIRKRKINGKLFWCVIRWVHPKLALGLLAEGVYGLTNLPVIVLKVATDDDQPRDVTYRDLDSVVKLEKAMWRDTVEAWDAERKATDAETRNVGREYAHEVKAAYAPKSYLSVAYMNQAYWDSQRGDC